MASVRRSILSVILLLVILSMSYSGESKSHSGSKKHEKKPFSKAKQGSKKQFSKGNNRSKKQPTPQPTGPKEPYSGGLSTRFYESSCPNVEFIIFSTLRQIYRNPDIAPDFLRLHFHDCFDPGCNGSVLLDGSGPGVVSFADILAYAARDSVVLTGGPGWRVAGGRRDGTASVADEATQNLPWPQMMVRELNAKSSKHGLSQEDMVVLSGAHTIGDTACHHIDDRHYNYPSPTMEDPDIPPKFLRQLKRRCPEPRLQLTTVEMDQFTFRRFDTQYYTNFVNKNGVMSSDQILFNDASTRPMVLARQKKNTFFLKFPTSMLKMSQISTLTRTKGEIRFYCRVDNSI